MGRTKRRRAIKPLALSLALACAVSTVPKSLADQPDFTIRDDVRLVLLDVGVTDRKGSLVAGLSKDNFKVFDNGAPVNIGIFANLDVPVTVGLIVDESLSMRPKRPEVINAALTFIGASNPKDEVFVLNFNNTVTPGLPHGVLFSDNVDQLRGALYRGKPEGQTALYDAIVRGLRQLDKGRRDKKTLIVISDGGDNVSLTNKNEMLDLVSKSAATIYTIGLFDAGDPDRNPAILKQLANMTGGEAYFPESVDDAIPICRAIAAAIRSRYTIGFQPAPPGLNPMRHNLTVKVSGPGGGKLTAHTRTGYWTEESTDTSNGGQSK